MSLLLDTHVFLWALLDSSRLGTAVATRLADPDVPVVLSTVSAWEIAIKESLGKLVLPAPSARWVPEAARRLGVSVLPLEIEAALAVSSLPWHHRDPFDRLLVAQAARGHTLVTHDRALEPYGVDILWV